MPSRPQLTLRLANSPGSFAAVTRALTDERIRVEAFSLESRGVLRLVVDNPIRAAGVLRERHHQVTVEDVLVVNTAAGRAGTEGMAHAALLVASAGVNVEYAYGAASAGSDSLCVLGVDDAQRAATAAGV